MVSLWANRFRGGYVSIDNDLRPGMLRTSINERRMKLMGDALVQHMKNFLEPREQKLHRKMQKNQPQLLMAGPFILHDNARLHIAGVVSKIFVIMGGKCYFKCPTVQS